MTALRVVLAAVAVGCAATATGQEKKEQKLSDDVVAVLEKATELDVYSLAGTAQKGDKDAWRGAKVLGKTTVKKDAERKAVVEAVKKGVVEGGQPARCFIPRHGVSATHNGKTVDLVICFECGWIYVYVDGEKQNPSLTISGTPEKPLNGVLAAAKIPLDKPKK
jgi:hypothetical protein